MLILEHFQWSSLPALVDRHGIGTDAQPQVLGEAAFLALWTRDHQVAKTEDAGEAESSILGRTW